MCEKCKVHLGTGGWSLRVKVKVKINMTLPFFRQTVKLNAAWEQVRGGTQRVVMRLGLWETYVTCMWQVDWPEPGSSWWFWPQATPQGRWCPPAAPQTQARNLWLHLPKINKQGRGKWEQAGSDLQTGKIKVLELRVWQFWGSSIKN